MDRAAEQDYDEYGSPTQVNEGRSYDRYQAATSPPSLNLGLTQAQNGSGNDLLDRSLNENDTGAVNFDSLDSDRLGFESPITNGGGRAESNGCLSIAFPNSDNEPPITAADFAPETPAPPKNPFAGKFQTPLAGSQLFVQTPFSAAFDQGSPTSSRPSPSDLPMQPVDLPHTSSPLKPCFPTSNTSEQTPMPMLQTLATSSQSRYDGVTPARPAVLQHSSPSNRRRRAQVPISEYEPMKQSQERRQASSNVRLVQSSNLGSISEDDNSDASQKRRRIIRRRKYEATKILSTISVSEVTAPQHDVEVPASTRKQTRPRPEGRQPDVPVDTGVAMMEGKTAEGPRASLAESEAYGSLSFPQSMIDAYGTTFMPTVKTPSSSAAILPEVVSTVAKPSRTPLHLRSSLNGAEAIPETSPAVKQTPVVKMEAQAHASGTTEASVAETLISQRMPSLSNVEEDQTIAYGGLDEVISQLKQASKRDFDAEQEAATSSPPVMLTYTTKRRLSKSGPVKTETDREGASLAASTTGSLSTLSSLSSTPRQLSREGTPITANESDLSTRGSDRKHTATDAEGDNPLRASRRRLHQSNRSLQNPRQKSLRTTANTSASTIGVQPAFSDSTDELGTPLGSSTAPTLSRRSSRAPQRTASTRSALTTSTIPHGGSTTTSLFAGMVFAVSMSKKRDDESTKDFAKREKQFERLEKRIREAGASIVEQGFNELFRSPRIISALSRQRTAFELSDDNLQLVPRAAETGFTALIADGYSRKVKYMQALALGLPCLAPHWITVCLDRNELVDWSPYLLCAGPSSFLGGIIRSRNLTYYNASTARLADVVLKRPKLLEGATILILLSKAVGNKRDGYIFLAHILGASLTRGGSLEEAREHLKTMQDIGLPYDWLYTDHKADLDRIFRDRPAQMAGKKRKWPNGKSNDISSSRSAETNGHAPTPVKTLSDERMIQSLIFGKLIEDEYLVDDN